MENQFEERYDAFISYRRKNGMTAEFIRDRLKERGIKCFVDLEEDRQGEFNEHLYTAIENADSFILILTKGSLKRCVRKKDWVRKEILHAIEHGKKIIPIRDHTFEWSKEFSVHRRVRLPEQIVRLEKKQTILISMEYLAAMIDKVVAYMTGKKHNSDPSKNLAPLESTEFFESALKKQDLQCIDMAFHAGSAWQRNTDKVELLRAIVEKKISLRVIVNTNESAGAVCDHMKQPMKKYVGFDSNVEDWLELAKRNPDTVSVRVSDVPILHRLYITRNKDGSGAVNIKYYTYGNYTPDKDFRRSFVSPSSEYKLYTEEFDYLWEHTCKEV